MPENLPSSDPPGGVSTRPANAQTSAPESLIVMLGATLRAAWQPRRIPPPEVDPGLTELSGIERCSEVLRYKLLQLEYTLSSGGGLRAWLLLNLLACFLVGIPALLVVPVVTWLLSSFSTWSEFLFRIALNLLYTILAVAAIVVVVMALGYGIKAYAAFMLKRRSEQQYRRR